jgi:hypothetical protein
MSSCLRCGYLPLTDELRFPTKDVLDQPRPNSLLPDQASDRPKADNRLWSPLCPRAVLLPGHRPAHHVSDK